MDQSLRYSSRFQHRTLYCFFAVSTGAQEKWSTFRTQHIQMIQLKMNSRTWIQDICPYIETERAGPVDFMSRWKAVAGKEVLTRAQSRKLNTDTHSIVVWRDTYLSVIARCLPRKFNINKLKAAKAPEKGMYIVSHQI
jgi:hypothetical protein